MADFCMTGMRNGKKSLFFIHLCLKYIVCGDIFSTLTQARLHRLEA